MLTHSSHAEPDQIDSQFARDRCEQGNDDESDFEKIEEEGEKEHEDIDEDQKAHHAARQAREHVLDPARAIHTLKHKAEAGRADQDEHHHCGEAHGRCHGLFDQRPGEAAMHGGERDRADRAHRAGLGRRRKAEPDGAENKEDQDDGGDHAPTARG